MPENDELKKYLDYDGLDYLIKRIPRTRIIVTFDDVFAGETATCSLGTTVYTNTIPATSPYQLVFSVVELGTWTIATSYLGDDYGTTVEVTGVGTTATGHVSYVSDIDGETVTPTDDITTWLKCANIEDSSITTLADVLANRSLFETLIANSNACKYMARSTTWVGNYSAKVPTMTGTTTPSGEVIAISQYSGATYYPWHVFDGNSSTIWCPSSSGPGVWIGYIFPEKQTISKFRLAYSSDRTVPSVTVQASDDGTTWTDLDTITTSASSDAEYSFNNTNSYYRYRLVFNMANGIIATISIIQFYDGVQGVTTSQDAMALIGKYDYCSNALLSNATWAEAIANSDYFDCVLNVYVPLMTSNTTPSGEVIASGSNSSSSHPYWHAFDKNTSTYWLNTTGNPNYIGYDFGYDVEIHKVVLTNLTGTGVKLQGYDESDWVDIDDSILADSGTKTYIVSASTTYRKFRLVNATQLYEAQFYGRKSNEVLVPLVPTMTSDTAPSGQCSASTVTSGGYDAWRAFDGNDSTNGWCPNISTSSLIGAWIKYEFPKQVKVDRIRALQRDSASTDTTYKLEASNDDTNWTTISDSLIMTKNSVVTFSDVTTSTKYRYYRITMLTNTITGTIRGFKFQFYEKGVQTNIIHSASNDTIYMMENGSQVPLCTTNSDGDGVLDFTQFTDGTYVLYSSVAKAIDNTSNDYSKSVRITKTSYGCTTEVYLMPDTVKTPYWFGNIFGKSVAGSLTKNTNYLYISGNNSYFYGNIPDVDFRGEISKVKLLVNYDNNLALNLDESTTPSNIPTSVQPFYIAWYDNNSHTYNQYIIYKSAYNTDSYAFNRRDGKYYLRIHAIWME